MNETCEIKNLLDVGSKVLLRCFILGVVFMLLWFLFILVGADFAHGIHSKWFPISKEQFLLLNYVGMGISKLFLIGVFLIPYISIRLVLCKKS
jgi:hypothetical protein